MLGGNSALTAVQLRDGEHESSYLSGVHQFSSAAGVLLLAAVVVAGIGVARWAAPLRHVARFGPEASVESKPEGG